MKLPASLLLISGWLLMASTLYGQNPDSFYDPHEETRRMDSLYEHTPDITRKEVIVFLDDDNLRRDKAFYKAYRKRMKRRREKKKNKNSQQLSSFSVDAVAAQATNEGSVPDAVEYAALQALYEATRGFQWPKQDNWLQGTTSADMGTWFGIVTRGGDVVRIVLEYNLLKGTLPAELADLTSLEELRFGNNLLTGVSPAIGSLPNLKRIILSQNRIAELPLELGNLSSLEELWLRNNRLTALPPQLGNLSNLTFLSLFDNRLTSLPTTIGQLSALTYLGLRNNELTTLPSQIGSLSSLEQLWLRDNQLTEVPPTLPQLTQLKKLSFYGNQLTQVPTALTQLTQLQDLRLMKNQLANLPEELTQLPALQKLTIYDNLIDLNDIARFLTGPDSYTYTSFVYRPQESVSDTVRLSGAAPTLDPYAYQHPRSRYQWQKEADGTWQDITEATQATYTVEASTARYYRCRLTNDWLSNMTQYSAVFDVTTPPTFFLEAECATVGQNWQTVTDVTASAGQYLVYPQGNRPTSPSNQAADHVRFSFDLDNPDDFYLLARVKTPTSNDDSFWVRIDDQPWQKWTQGVRTTQWDWKVVSSQPFALGAGQHTITFSYREDGAQLDKLYLSVSDTPPPGVGEADPQCTGESLALWQEAECVTYGSYWDPLYEQEGASNQSLLQANTAYSGGLGPNAPERLVTFTVETSQPGSYHLFARHFLGSGPESSFSVRINEGPWQDWTPAHGGSLSWSTVLGAAVVLEGGVNTITFRNRFEGSQLDKLFVSSDPTAPTGLGEEDAACVDNYVPPTPPSIVNNPPDGTTAPAVATGRGGSIPRNSNTNVNYVRSFTPRQPYPDAGQVSLARPVDQVSVSTEYIDGLGRPLQTVVRGGSGSATQDLVQPITYDAYGRRPKQYLPYATNGATGGYRSDALFDQYTYYTTAPANVARSGYPYAEMEYEPSPLNRVAKQAAPGEAWRLGSGREVTIDYLTNSGSEVRRWKATSTLSADGTYGANELYKTLTTDENDHTTTEFVNKLDQVVLKRVQGPDGNQDTYYVYDEYNLLRYVIPPEATQRLSSNASLAGNATFQEQWLFVYRYDELRRMTEKQVPGGGTIRLKYDQWNRPVLTQSALQANRGEWSFTKYDELNRPIMTGVTTSATVSGARFETPSNSTLGYTLTGSPHAVSVASVRTVTYYDNYSFPHASEGGFSFNDNIAARTRRSEIIGQVTGTLTRKLDDNTLLKSVTYYDEQYRPIQAITDNHVGGKDRLTTEYRNTVNSEVLSTKRVHSSSQGSRTITQNYQYDHAGRLTQVTHQLDNQSAVVLSAQQYNELGELVEKQLGGGQQTVDYRYNIRGWLTRINELGSEENYFNQRLHYDFGFEKKSYNGNIAGVQWQRAGGKQHAYGYLYDPANRITGADYRLKPVAASSWTTEPGNFSVDKVNYDRNGNIGELKRYGEQEERLYLWDDLTYSYSGNRLRSVQDAGEAEVGFTDGADTGNEYGYDESGNMTRDDNKGISNVTYDAVLNLPTEVVINGKGTIRYTYDASGTKLRQQVIPLDGSPTKTTDYVQGFHYEDNQLAFIQHEEGRLIVKDGLAYHYDLKDHLGNTRVTFSDTPMTTTAQATMEAGAASVEEAVFEGVAESRRTMAFHNTTDATIGEPDPKQVAALLPGQQGPAKSVRVHAGDTVRLEVNARYETAPGQVQGLEGIATQVAGAAARVAGGVEGASAGSGLNPTTGASALANSSDEGVPLGYLNYVLYDEDFTPVDKGFQKVSKAAAIGKANPNSEAERLTLEVPIAREGYLYTYLSHEAGSSPVASGSSARTAASTNASSGVPVYFDDFTVEQQSYIVQVDDYYPFGASFDQNLNRTLENRYLYNGKEITTDLGLNWYDYQLRQYDPILGRWMSPDVLADEYSSWSPYAYSLNNPVRFIDPDGAAPVDANCPECPPPSGSYVVHQGRQGFVDASIEYFTGMVEGAKTVLGFTEANDVSVLATGRNIDGSRASGTDYMFAGAGVFLPVSGSVFKKGLGKLTDFAFGQGRKLTDGSKGAIFESDVLGSLKDDIIAENIEVFQNGTRFTELDGVMKDGSLVQIFTGGGHADQLKKTVDLAIKSEAPGVKVFYSSDISQRTIDNYKRTVQEAFPDINGDYYIEWLQRAER